MFRKQQQLFSFDVSVRIVMLFVVALLLTFAYAEFSLQRSKQQLNLVQQQNATRLRQLASISEEIKKHGGVSDIDAKINALQQELEAGRYLLEVLGDVYARHRHGFSGYLEGFARRVVKGMWITRFDMQDGGKEVQLSGAAMDPASVPQFIEQLSQEQRLSGTHFEVLKMHRPSSARAWVDFTLASDGFEKSPFDLRNE